MLPMGTIMASCMFVGLATVMLQALLKKGPVFLFKMIGFIVLAGGLWNVFWYGVQHYTEFWGQAALASGVLMILTGLYIIQVRWLSPILLRLKPIVLLLLLAWAVTYSIKIASL